MDRYEFYKRFCERWMRKRHDVSLGWADDHTEVVVKLKTPVRLEIHHIPFMLLTRFKLHERAVPVPDGKPLFDCHVQLDLANLIGSASSFALLRTLRPDVTLKLFDSLDHAYCLINGPAMTLHPSVVQSWAGEYEAPTSDHQDLRFIGAEFSTVIRAEQRHEGQWIERRAAEHTYKENQGEEERSKEDHQ